MPPQSLTGINIGVGTTNTREVSVADVDGDGKRSKSWSRRRAPARKTGMRHRALFSSTAMLQVAGEKTLIDDHRGQTHTRMVAVADVKNDGINRIVSSAVGVVQPDSGRIDPLAELRTYTPVLSPACARHVEPHRHFREYDQVAIICRGRYRRRRPRSACCRYAGTRWSGI